MTDLQQKEMEMLSCFVKICETLNLEYYLVCGTALGAVKYKGFIPWDDDMDVALPRDDYERFLQQAPKMLPEGLFLQNYRTDPAFPHVFTKLRNSNTTYIEKEMAHLQINHGIYIDIFPLDGYPKKRWQQRGLELQKKLCTWVQYSALTGSAERKVQIRNRILRSLGAHKHTAAAAGYADRLFAKYAVRESQLWCNHGNWQRKLEYAPRWHYGNGILAEFEGLQVRVPENYDAYLTQKYGNWRADLPEDQKIGHHFYTIFDSTRPYWFYTENKHTSI